MRLSRGRALQAEIELKLQLGDHQTCVRNSKEANKAEVDVAKGQRRTKGEEAIELE